MYYTRNISRVKALSKNMLDFHNYWVKNENLLNYLPNMHATKMVS